MGKHKNTEERNKQKLKGYISNLVTLKENKFKIENCLSKGEGDTFEVDIVKLKEEIKRVYN